MQAIILLKVLFTLPRIFILLPDIATFLKKTSFIKCEVCFLFFKNKNTLHVLKLFPTSLNISINFTEFDPCVNHSEE